MNVTARGVNISIVLVSLVCFTERACLSETGIAPSETFFQHAGNQQSYLFPNLIWKGMRFPRK